MTEALAAVERVRHHINVNAIAPGAFSWEMMDGMLERMGEITKELPASSGLGQPEQMDVSTSPNLCDLALGLGDGHRHPQSTTARPPAR